MNALKNELYRLFKMKKMYVFAMIMTTIAILNLYDYEPGSERTVWTFEFGQSVPLTLVGIFAQFMIIFIPIVLGDSISNDYRSGTLKLSLLRPLTRTKLLQAKMVTLLVFIVVSTLFFIVLSYGLGTYFLGWGNVTEYGESAYPPITGIFLTLAAYALFMLPSMAYGAFVSLIAVLSKNMSTTIMVSLVLITIGLNLNDLDAIAPYSLASHLLYFPEKFMLAQDWTGMLQSVGVILIYLAVFSWLSFRFFKNKDIVY